jgi:hypothetical protein
LAPRSDHVQVWEKRAIGYSPASVPKLSAIVVLDEHVSCRWCGEAFAVVRGRRGRPSLFCSVTCRRAVEFQLRKLYRDHGRTAMDVRLFGGLDTRMHLRGIEMEITRLGGNVANIFGVRE